jgi:predicted nucleotidyltransferase
LPILADQNLAEAVRRLCDAYAPERIYLFGSRARGDDGPDSDYDLLVVVPDGVAPEARTSRIGYQALRGTGIAADVVVCSHGYFEARVHGGMHDASLLRRRQYRPGRAM